MLDRLPLVVADLQRVFLRVVGHWGANPTTQAIESLYVAPFAERILKEMKALEADLGFRVVHY